MVIKPMDLEHCLIVKASEAGLAYKNEDQLCPKGAGCPYRFWHKRTNLGEEGTKGAMGGIYTDRIWRYLK